MKFYKATVGSILVPLSFAIVARGDSICATHLDCKYCKENSHCHYCGGTVNKQYVVGACVAKTVNCDTVKFGSLGELLGAQDDSSWAVVEFTGDHRQCNYVKTPTAMIHASCTECVGDGHDGSNEWCKLGSESNDEGFCLPSKANVFCYLMAQLVSKRPLLITTPHCSGDPPQPPQPSLECRQNTDCASCNLPTSACSWCALTDTADPVKLQVINPGVCKDGNNFNCDTVSFGTLAGISKLEGFTDVAVRKVAAGSVCNRIPWIDAFSFSEKRCKRLGYAWCSFSVKVGNVGTGLGFCTVHDLEFICSPYMSKLLGLGDTSVYAVKLDGIDVATDIPTASFSMGITYPSLIFNLIPILLAITGFEVLT